jgi:hypothetical protein
VTWLSLHGNDVAALKVKIINVLVVGAACVFEAHLKDIRWDIYGILLQPISLVELVATLRCDSLNLIATVAEGTSSPHLWNMFFTTTHYR